MTKNFSSVKLKQKQGKYLAWKHGLYIDLDHEINRFPTNGHMLGFRAKIKVAALSYSAVYDKQYQIKVLLCSFHLNGHTLGFHTQT